MSLLTEELKAKLPPLYATKDIPEEEKEIIAKFFSPDSNWTWYVVEGEFDEDLSTYKFFGLVEGHETEWGYFVLRELEDARGPLGLRIERDRFFTGTKIKDLVARKRRVF